MTGWKLTPREPVNTMENAGVDEGANHFGLGVDEGQVSAIWRSMSESAPAPTDEVLERMARAFWRRAFDRDPSARGLPDAMRAALTAAEGRSDG